MSEINPELIESLLNEFVERLRHGESPSISAYETAHPQYAQQIRELFRAAPIFLTPKSRPPFLVPPLPRPLASILAKGTSKDTMPTVRGRLWASGETGEGRCGVE